MRNGGSSGRHLSGHPPRLDNAPPDVYQYQEYEEEEEEYEYQDCCCITGFLRSLDLIQVIALWFIGVFLIESKIMCANIAFNESNNVCKYGRIRK
ncbi:hypothetical protein CDAR_116401 [Caerostris darwini]|uniref:Uncharacterized protein n=1 Tax=Caerostris darwini TaxID=1538125 RepID=A0AAV4WM46_9ARAC|nr:hypothetical protein CDAR_206451 [Caerostris darwini]GIY83398.1 hypothetical protein CDAR_116401 [Caerostris darwini]